MKLRVRQASPTALDRLPAEVFPAYIRGCAGFAGFPAGYEMLPKLLKWIADENEARKAKGEPQFKYVDGKYLMSAPPQQLGQVGSRAALTAPGAPTEATSAGSPAPVAPAPAAPSPAK